jgi:hypothetical protein
MTGMMPVAGRCATSSAITTAVPRRNPYGDAIIRPTRTGTSRPTRPSCESMICCTGSGRPTGGAQSPSDLRGTRSRSRLPNAYRSARSTGRLRRDA